jgi:ankyrin repeat protein
MTDETAYLSSYCVHNVFMFQSWTSFQFLQAGMTPLHFAALHKRPKVAKLLITNGANVNIRGEVSETYFKR